MEHVEFTKEMKKTHKILIPSMLPIHFELAKNAIIQAGYQAEILTNEELNVVDVGLANVHNDTCYPATIVIGQMIDALKSGRYDVDHVALMITQTGGGCRASNYIHLLRKALQKAGFEQVPVISLNFSSMEKNSGFKMPPSLLVKLAFAILYGDLLMWIKNQCQPYEIHKNETQGLCQTWIEELSKQFHSLSFLRIRKNLKEILYDFSSIAMYERNKMKVGIVGEIYMKYAPLGNHELENFLLKENVEVVLSPVLDFALYCLSNVQLDYALYGMKKQQQRIAGFALNAIQKLQNVLISMIKKDGNFIAFEPYEEVVKHSEGIIHKGVKMGEGWLLTAEMVSLIKQQVPNIISCQPFGCLPNHIVAKGMIRKLKNLYPQSNIVAIDYDAGASIVNQENRIKLMLANAQFSKTLHECKKQVSNSCTSLESKAIHPLSF